MAETREDLKSMKKIRMILGLLVLVASFDLACFKASNPFPEDMADVEERHLLGVWHLEKMRENQSVPDFARVYLNFEKGGRFELGPADSESETELRRGRYSLSEGILSFELEEHSEKKIWSTPFELRAKTLVLEKDPYLRLGKSRQSCSSLYKKAEQ